MVAHKVFNTYATIIQNNYYALAFQEGSIIMQFCSIALQWFSNIGEYLFDNYSTLIEGISNVSPTIIQHVFNKYWICIG